MAVGGGGGRRGGPDREQGWVRVGEGKQKGGPSGPVWAAGRQVAVGSGLPVLTPFNTSSRWSRNCMNRLIFQLVLQFTELTWGRAEGTLMPGRPPAVGEWGMKGPVRGWGEDQPSFHQSTERRYLLEARAPRPQPAALGLPACGAKNGADVERPSSPSWPGGTGGKDHGGEGPFCALKDVQTPFRCGLAPPPHSPLCSQRCH